MRTQIGFDHLTLKSAKLNEQSDEIFKDISSRMQFELHGVHVEKPVMAQRSVSLGPRPRSAKKIGF